MTIESISHSLAGNYTCAAENRAGFSEFTADLHVNGDCFIDHALYYLLVYLVLDF